MCHLSDYLYQLHSSLNYHAYDSGKQYNPNHCHYDVQLRNNSRHFALDNVLDELLFTAGMLKIQESLTVPVLPPIPEKPTLPEIPLGQNLFNDQYQRALHVAPKAKLPKQSDDVEIEIVGDGINMDGIHTLTGSF